MIVLFSLCVFMGLLQINENLNLLKQNNGQLSINQTFSAIEFLWVFVVLYFLFFEQLGIYGLVTCLIYIAYNVCGWIMGVVLIKDSGKLEFSNVPSWYLRLNVLWVAVFFLSSVFTLVTLVL